jgi:hypothetical protein
MRQIPKVLAKKEDPHHPTRLAQDLQFKKCYEHSSRDHILLQQLKMWIRQGPPVQKPYFLGDYSPDGWTLEICQPDINPPSRISSSTHMEQGDHQ